MNQELGILTRILQSQTKDELEEIGDFFGVLLRKSDKKAVMVERLEAAFRTDMLRCLKCLPVYELRNLQRLVSQGRGVRMSIPIPRPPLFTYLFGLLEDDDTSGDQGPVMRMYLEDEIFDLVAPVIDTAIKEVEESGRVEFERFLWGCLTIYGLLSMEEFIDLRRGFFPDEDLRAIYKFLDTYAPLDDLTDDFYEFLMYPELSQLDLITAQESRGYYGRELANVPLEDILAAGETTPYNYPYGSHPVGQVLAEALKAVGVSDDNCGLWMHRIWWEKQNGGANPRSFNNLIQRLLTYARIDSIDSLQPLLGAITAYFNAIPTWLFRGRSSREIGTGSVSYNKYR